MTGGCKGWRDRHEMAFALLPLRLVFLPAWPTLTDTDRRLDAHCATGRSRIVYLRKASFSEQHGRRPVRLSRAIRGAEVDAARAFSRPSHLGAACRSHRFFRLCVHVRDTASSYEKRRYQTRLPHHERYRPCELPTTVPWPERAHRQPKTYRSILTICMSSLSYRNSQ